MNSSKRVIQTQQKNDTQANPIQKISSRLVGNPTVCLHGTKIGSIDLANTVALFLTKIMNLRDSNKIIYK